LRRGVLKISFFDSIGPSLRLPRRMMSESTRCDRLCGLTADHFHTKMIAMLAAVFVDNAHHDGVVTDFEIGRKARNPDVRTRLRLDPRFLSGFVLGKHLFDKGIWPPLAFHPHRQTLADLILDNSTRAAVENVDDHIGRAGPIPGDRRAKKQTHPEIRVQIRVDPLLIPV
jgi:hypothetical protein